LVENGGTLLNINPCRRIIRLIPFEVLIGYIAGKLESWKAGKLESWKAGKLESWNI
jgi:hypothetical protein